MGGVEIDRRGLMWKPLTDKQVSFVMGAIAIDLNNRYSLMGTGEENFAQDNIMAGIRNRPTAAPRGQIS